MIFSHVTRQDDNDDPHHRRTPYGHRVHKLEDPLNWPEQQGFTAFFERFKRFKTNIKALIKNNNFRANPKTKQPEMKHIIQN